MTRADIDRFILDTLTHTKLKSEAPNTLLPHTTSPSLCRRRRWSPAD